MILGYQDQREILQKHQIKEADAEIVFQKDDLDLAVEKVGYPLAMKISSKEHLHRTELGGVFLNIKAKEEVDSVFERLMKIEGVDGVILQKMIEGFEFIIGAKHDSSFGPIVMLGSGGTMVELFNDVTFAVAPLKEREVEKMIDEIQGKNLLNGFRGKEVIEKNELVDLLVKTSNLITSENIKEVEFNPVIVNKEGVFVCDVKIHHVR